ncbi:MAG: SMP-30/gluconolactonase/LRE family protein [Clostridia bacterium]|nr:SMP-30/gluconolactonase/LRE family protein [Clostridia bacterium]
MKSQLFCILPPGIHTPDGMETDREGNLILSCPNFADEKTSGAIYKITKEGKATKWFDVPVHPETGAARNMGIAFDDREGLFICDNQGWSEKPELLFKGRLLRVQTGAGGIVSYKVTAYGMEHPNGVRYKDGYVYVTQSYMHPVKRQDGLLTSGVYRFSVDDENIEIHNDLSDKNLLCTFVTRNPLCQYGCDGIVFAPDGSLLVGNFGDGEVWRIVLDGDGKVKEKSLFAKNEKELQSTDGMCFDPAGNLYIADFSANALCRVSPDGRVERIASSPDTDGLHGELNQPGEPICFDGKIVVSCFNLVTGPDKVNKSHTMPCTLAFCAAG